MYTKKLNVWCNQKYIFQHNLFLSLKEASFAIRFAIKIFYFYQESGMPIAHCVFTNVSNVTWKSYVSNILHQPQPVFYPVYNWENHFSTYTIKSHLTWCAWKMVKQRVPIIAETFLEVPWQGNQNLNVCTNHVTRMSTYSYVEIIQQLCFIVISI